MAALIPFDTPALCTLNNRKIEYLRREGSPLLIPFSYVCFADLFISNSSGHICFAMDIAKNAASKIARGEKELEQKEEEVLHAMKLTLVSEVRSEGGAQ